MAIFVYTADAHALLSAIQEEVAKGDHIKTWKMDGDGDFTHSPASGQFEGRAWFQPSIMPGCLAFNILPQKTGVISVSLYGIYHGRFAEMLLNHFDQMFTNLTLTALARLDWGDRVVGSDALSPQ